MYVYMYIVYKYIIFMAKLYTRSRRRKRDA